MHAFLIHTAITISVIVVVLGATFAARLFAGLFDDSDSFDWPEPEESNSVQEPEVSCCPKCQGKPVVKNGFRYCMTHSCDFIERIKP